MPFGLCKGSINVESREGGYASVDELAEIIEEAFEEALDNACVEIFEGKYESSFLRSSIDPAKMKATALALVKPENS